MAESHFDAWIAAHSETLWPELFEPAALDPVVDVLTDLAAGGPVLSSRWADWHPTPFTPDSDKHISLWTTSSP